MYVGLAASLAAQISIVPCPAVDDLVPAIRSSLFPPAQSYASTDWTLPRSAVVYERLAVVGRKPWLPLLFWSNHTNRFPAVAYWVPVATSGRLKGDTFAASRV